MDSQTGKSIERILLLRVVSSVFKKVKHPRGHRYPYMLKYMEGILRRDSAYDVKLVDMLIEPMGLSELIDVTCWQQPDLIVIFSTPQEYELTLEYASCIKKGQPAFIIGVGPDATARPERYLFENSPIDMVLPGDAEEELLKVIDNLNNGHAVEVLKDHYMKQKPLRVSNLDDLPFPRCGIKELKRYHHIYPVKINKRLVWGHILTSRGCPYPCMFCTEMIRETIGAQVRLRSAHNVVDEIEHLIKMGVNIIIFDDDNFTTLKEHVIAVCREIIRRELDIRWVAHARIDNMTYELAQTMRAAGCVLLRFGIESGSERVIRILEKGHHGDWMMQAKQAFGFCKEFGIGTVALFMIGSPTETEEDIRESIQAAKTLEPDALQVSFFTFYPDTKASRRFGGDQVTIKFSQMYHFTVPDHRLNFSQVDNVKLNRLQKYFYKEVLLDPKFIFRHLVQYGLFYIYNPHIFFSLSQIRRYLIQAN